MGGCVSVSIPCDQSVNQVSDCLCRKASYVYKLEENLEALEIGKQRLMQRREDVLGRVNLEEARGLQRLETVRGWIEEVRAIETEVNELLAVKKAELERLCLWDYFSKDCRSTYQYSKQVVQKRGRVEDLETRGDFTEVTGRALPPSVVEMPAPPTIGLGRMLEIAWKHLMRDEVGILGLYGMGGVGKTTLLTHLNNKFLEASYGFENVIWVAVSQNLDIELVQEDIGEKLGVCDEEWKQKRRDKKAIDIYNVLCRKKFLLLLDDIWKKVPLHDIGVPYPDKNNGCKVAFTTRSRDVCGQMEADAEMKVECLSNSIAWKLFQRKVGENTLNSHPQILGLARILAEKCHGLPLALNIIGMTMARKTTVQEWHHAVDVLTSAATKFSGMDEILHTLKFSYDNLEENKIKNSLLHCALFPEDIDIRKMVLIGQWFGQGILDGNRDWNSVENEGYEIIGTLVRACLLMEDISGDAVKMHDVVREMALWIASDSGKQGEKFIVKTGAQLCQIPNVEDWQFATKMSLCKNQIENISDSPNCPRLLTLLVVDNKLKSISGKFFLLMPNLVVLDLSRNFSLEELPEEISKLVSLQYLSLRSTEIKRLPVSLKELRKLIYLNLSSSKIQSIDGISCLSNLQVLGLFDCDGSLILGLIQELQRFEHLKHLLISLKGDHVLGRCIGIRKLVSVTRGVSLQGLESPLDLTWLTSWDCLKVLQIASCDVPEIKIDWGKEMITVPHNGASPCNPHFLNLSVVVIKDCSQIRDLTWLLFAPNLTRLAVVNTPQLEEIISREKAFGVINGQPSIMPFQALRYLKLRNLDELKSISWSPLPFPCLSDLRIWKCPKLKKLPLNSKSAEGRRISIQADKGSIEGVEWEDDATEKRFSHMLMAL